MAEQSRQIALRPIATTPTRSVPSTPGLPNLVQGNSFFGQLHKKFERDTQAVQAHAALLRARADQAQACAELIGKREILAVAIARLDTLGELIEHDYQMGRLTRFNELRRLELQHELDEIKLQIDVAVAKQLLAQYQPSPVAAQTRSTGGLKPSDVRSILEQFPDIKPEQIEPIMMMLQGFAAEKQA